MGGHKHNAHGSSVNVDARSIHVSSNLRGVPIAIPLDDDRERRIRIATIMPRILAFVLCTLALSFLVTANETKRIADLEMSAKWNDTQAFLALVPTLCICMGHSLLQLMKFVITFLNKGKRSAISTGWISFAVDQLLTYTLLATASAATEVASIAKCGAEKAGWSEVCTMFSDFCNRVGLSLILSFCGVLAMGTSSLVSAYNAMRLHLCS